MFKDLGTDTITAIRMFLTQALVPFEIKRPTVNPYKALIEQEILDRLERSREHAVQGMYKDATEVSCGVREKYGL